MALSKKDQKTSPTQFHMVTLYEKDQKMSSSTQVEKIGGIQTVNS